MPGCRDPSPCIDKIALYKQNSYARLNRPESGDLPSATPALGDLLWRANLNVRVRDVTSVTE